LDPGEFFSSVDYGVYVFTQISVAELNESDHE
jgi:hypothetical protein